MGWQAAMIEHAFADWQDYLFEDAGDPCEQLYCGRNYDPAKFGYQAAGQLFDDHKPGKGPYSIFTVNDHDARGVYQAAKEHGVEVGTDVHVVGFGNYAFAGKLNPALSTIATEENDGYAAAKLLWHIRQARPAKPIRQVLAARLIERASSLGLDGGRAHAGNDSRSASPLPAHV
jgi:DNA-binding LacI/PurR family transcriptional regulator